MKRRDFVTTNALGLAGLIATPSWSLESYDEYLLSCTNRKSIEDIDQLVRDAYESLLDWIESSGWGRFLENEMQIKFDKLSALNSGFTCRPINDFVRIAGTQDFGGNKLIEPGSPSRSLLYHILASPAVLTNQVNSYPSIEQLDALENYIYELAFWNEELLSSQTHLMVLAYEYRCGEKAPPVRLKKHASLASEVDYRPAQLVFSRSGISRVGNHPRNYDARHRCFTNKPQASGCEKEIAVSPARFGLFQVELVNVSSNKIRLMNRLTKEYRGGFFARNDRYFINPIRKLYTSTDHQIEFAEYHKNEKLRRLSLYRYEDKAGMDPIRVMPSGFDTNSPPFVRISSRNDQGLTVGPEAPKDGCTEDDVNPMVELKREGSSVLLSPIPGDLVRCAQQCGKWVTIKVPPEFSNKFNRHTNRRYAALKLPNSEGEEVRNVIISDGVGRIVNKTRVRFKSPKNVPLFLNIKCELIRAGDNQTYHQYINDSYPSNEKFDAVIKSGGYEAQVFEDGICDGCVAAKLIPISGGEIIGVQAAPSFVTAPDFFPLVDSNDIRAHFSKDDHFFEGGTLNLSSIRMRGNPNIFNPYTGLRAFGAHSGKTETRCELGSDATEHKGEASYDTITAVVSNNESVTTSFKTQEPTGVVTRSSKFSSYMPDTGTGVFYPAWDITYSSVEEFECELADINNNYLATIGLGLPFAEDMKLCAAANGMWPVTSPDAGRTFQGSLDWIAGGRPNSSIPLMDDEIGFHANSPHVNDWGKTEVCGWDGEQGPFIEFVESNLVVNYTDISRADYIYNALKGPGFDMSQLRELESNELIDRMDCLEFSLRHLSATKVYKSKLWLVGAEKVEDWNQVQEFGCLPNIDAFSRYNYNRKQNAKLTGKGYFFVFAKVPKNKKNKDSFWDDRDNAKPKRRILACKDLYLCQVTSEYIAFVEFDHNSAKSAIWKNKSWSDRDLHSH